VALKIWRHGRAFLVEFGFDLPNPSTPPAEAPSSSISSAANSLGR